MNMMRPLPFPYTSTGGDGVRFRIGIDQVHFTGSGEYPPIEFAKRERAIARLRAIQHYTEGWDGESGAAPRPQAIADAIMLLTNLTRDFSFSVVPEPDGAVELSTQAPAGRAVLVFEGDGDADVFIRATGASYTCTKIEIPRRIGVDSELLNLLQPFADSP